MAEQRATSDRESVSVVVPAYNAGATLAACIDALLASDLEPAEIIIADDGSTDGATEAAAQAHDLVRVHRVGDKPGGPANARNVAAATASGGIIAFIDADVRVHPDTLGTLTEPIAREAEVVASFGSYDDRPEHPAAASLYANLRHHIVHQRAPSEGATFWSGIGAVQKEAFLDSGGFDLSFDKPSIEDVELGARLRRAGGRIRVVHRAQGTHLKRWTARGLWRTDVFARALPWARLSVEHPELNSSLNAGAREKLAALCVAGAIGLVATLPLSAPRVGWAGPLVAAGLCLAVWVVLNLGLLVLLARRGGAAALVIGSLLHAVYYLYSSAAYVLGGAWYRWRRALGEGPRLPAAAWLLFALGCAAGAMGCAAAGLADTAWLLDTLMGLERNPDDARYTLETLAGVQGRMLPLAGFGLAAAGALLVVGPGWFTTELRGLPGCARTVFGWPRSHALVVLGLTLAYGVFAGLHLDQQMRSDESSSFVMYAQTSPLVAMFTYEVPNNHILHTVLMWISVRLFGIEEWAVRLPAFAFSMLLPAMTYAAGRSLISAPAGLIAAGIVAGATFAVEVATNARGYPIVVVCMLGLLALLPMLSARRAGATLCAIALGVVGIYAVPVMAYPLGVAYAAALLLGPTAPERWTGLVVRLGITGVVTCIAAGSLYLPAWVLRTQSSPIAAISTVDDGSRPGQAIDAALLLYNTRAAVVQWWFPLPQPLAWIAVALMLAGLLACLARSRSSRALAAGVVLGPPAVFVATGLRIPPWWTLVWGFPLAALLIGSLLAALAGLALGRKGRERPWAVALAPVLAAALIATTAASRYPSFFPYWVGYRQAPAAAQALTGLDLRNAHVVAHGGMYRDINYQLNRLGVGGRPVVQTHTLWEPTLPRVLFVRADPIEYDQYADALRPTIADRVELVGTHECGTSWIEEYRVIEAEPAADGEPDSTGASTDGGGA